MAHIGYTLMGEQSAPRQLVAGAVAYVTERIDLMSFVTCPIWRYHPAVVAQKAATMALLSEGRFTLGLGADKNLNAVATGPLQLIRQEVEAAVPSGPDSTWGRWGSASWRLA